MGPEDQRLFTGINLSCQDIVSPTLAARKMADGSSAALSG
jgi:hypothetical protein